MSVLVVGSVALDTVETPFGRADRVLGGSAVFFGAAASLFGEVMVVGVVGDDYPMKALDFLRERDVDFSGVEQREGESFFWEGRYGFDLNTRETVETRLGVFADFQPRIPEAYRDARFVFLGNIDPGLQLDVLDQIDGPELVACDTMNYWIQRENETLLRLLGRVDMVVLNDEEIRELSGAYSIAQGARWVREHGPDYVIVKKGEHGAALFGPDEVFFAPGYPLEEVFDPTGAGDAFAGGVFGYLSGVQEVDEEALRRALVYGSATGSYAVEAFSVDRFRDLPALDVARRVEEFRRMTAFELDLEEVAVE